MSHAILVIQRPLRRGALPSIRSVIWTRWVRFLCRQGLRNPKSDMLWVAAAGPFMNLLMAFAWAALLKFAISGAAGGYSDALVHMSIAGITINAILIFLNLLPIPPLDGGRIAVSLLPNNLAWRFARLEPWGFPILLALLFSGILAAILSPMLAAFRGLLSMIFSF